MKWKWESVQGENETKFFCPCARVTGVVVRLIASDRGGVLHTWSIRWNRSSVKQGEKEKERKREKEKGRKEGDEAKKKKQSLSQANLNEENYILLCSILSHSFSLIYRDSRDIYNRSSLNQIYVVKTNFFLSTIDAKCPWNKFSPRNVKGLPRFNSIVYVCTYIYIVIIIYSSLEKYSKGNYF